MQLLFVGDGARDEAVIPVIVKAIIAYANLGAFRSWKSIRLNRGSGYSRKLRFAIEVARDAGLDGVVATLDCDRATKGERLQQLRAARDSHRAAADAFPAKVAAGEAFPHLEAWLLDDSKAVKDALSLPREYQIPNVRTCGDPKGTLDGIIVDSSLSEGRIELLTRIASRLSEVRCAHRDDTGFADFVCDLRAELE